MRLLALLALAGCLDPTYSDSTRCGPSGECPSGRTCAGGFCKTGSPSPDAAPLPDAPAPLPDAPAPPPDARPPDAPPPDAPPPPPDAPPPDAPPPLVPASGLVTMPLPFEVTLMWTDGSGIDHLVVSRGASPGGPFTVLDDQVPAGSVSFTDSTVDEGTTYYYTLTSVGFVQSLTSDPVSAVTPIAQPTPPVLTARPTASTVILSWTPVRNATAYRVSRASVAGGPYTMIAEVPQTSHQDPTVTPGAAFYYVVRAVKGALVSDDSVEASALPGRRVCVADRVSGAVLTFNAFASGDVPPLTILGNQTRMSFPQATVFDAANQEIFVGSLYGITVYDRTATGNTAPKRRIAGPHTGITVDPVNDMEIFEGELYVSDSSHVLVYPLSASGDVAPVRELNGSAHPVGISIDAATRQLLVADYSGGAGQILYFPIGFSDPGMEPTRRVVSTTPLHIAGDVLMHDGELVVADGSFEGPEDGRVLFFAPPTPSDCDGAGVCLLTPRRTLAGPATSLLHPRRLARDPRTDRLIVANYANNPIAVFTSSQVAAGGNQSPVTVFPQAAPTTIAWMPGATASQDELAAVSATNWVEVFRTSGASFSSTRILGDTTIGWVDALAADRSAGTLFAGFGRTRRFAATAAGWPAPQAEIITPFLGSLAVRGNLLIAASGYAPEIQTFLVTDTGDALPQRTLTSTIAFTALDVAVSPESAAIWVVGLTPTDNQPFLAAFDGNASGSQPPVVRIDGPSTGLYFPQGLAIDPVAGELFVADLPRVLVYDRPTQQGTLDLAPKRVLEGNRTTLSYPGGVLIDRPNRELYVLDASGVIVFPLDAAGDAAPTRRIDTGGKTLLANPRDLDFCR